MGPLVIPLLAGLFATGGAIAQNRANKAAARRAQAFEKEQTDTAVQRRVKDLQLAGLNPALAYEGSAQSASGTMVGQQDPMGEGISNARAAAEAASSLKYQQAQTALMKEQAFNQQFQRANIMANTVLQGEQARATSQASIFQAAQQPSTLRNAAAQALLAEYQLPGARASAAFNSTLGRYAPAANFLLGSAKTARSLFK